MTIKKSQLKETIKQVVRECLNEKCGGSTLPGGAKGGRMFKHIKQGYKGEKSADDAERIAAATVKDRLGQEEQVGADVVAEKKMTAEQFRKELSEVVDKMVRKRFNEALVNMKMGPSYKTVPDTLAQTSEPDQRARVNQYDPKVTEASHKVVSPNETDTAKENKALTIQTEPKVTENHRVQHRSYTTIKDLPNDPNVARDPENPSSDGA
jgi:hypothetical protein